MERTISGMMGKGSINHNKRVFSAKNVDKGRSRGNVEFCHEDIKAVYHKLFDEALERYNAKQKRSDRKIGDYYEKIRQGKQEKLFYEAIFRIGNRDDMNAKSGDGQLAKAILVDFMADFQKRNPNLYVFSAHLHMDEETPHVHVDFVPFIRGSKRGLDTRVSLKGALAAQGFSGGTRGATEWNQWMESEKCALASVMERYGVGWLQKGTHNRHLSVLDFEKQEREKEVASLGSQITHAEGVLKMANNLVDSRIARAEELAEMREKIQRKNEELQAGNAKLEQEYAVAKQEHLALSARNDLLQSENTDLEQKKIELQSANNNLEEQQQMLQKEIEGMADIRARVEQNVQSYDRDWEWQLPEPGLMQTAKAYRDKVAFPLVSRLKELVKGLTVKCFGLMEQVKRLTEKVEKQEADIEWYKGKIRQQIEKEEILREKVADLERVKRFVGEDKVQEMVVFMNRLENFEREQKR